MTKKDHDSDVPVGCLEFLYDCKMVVSAYITFFWTVGVPSSHFQRRKGASQKRMVDVADSLGGRTDPFHSPLLATSSVGKHAQRFREHTSVDFVCLSD